VVLEATGCREGWLQGELFRRLSPLDLGFSVNTFQIPDGKADISGTVPTRMAGEIKVYGISGYQNKNLAGYSNIDEYDPGEYGLRRDWTWEEIASLAPAKGSFLRDAQRLFTLQTSDRAVEEAYLILVLFLNGPPSTFGRVIQAVRLPCPEITFEYEQFTVRIWRIELPQEQTIGED
jgi:hypothetical protein